ncbi:isopropylmalate isomerase [Altererythrobacter aquiaggeris]|uniref:isopropylmalate isomerase n=1 Tax=Aestuarierythrobacter aquiaggeris TaxID=1898396 RepID=UPI003015F3D9
MTKRTPGSMGGKATIAGAIGSAAIAAAVLYASRRKEKKEPPKTSTAPKQKPETD